MAMATDNDDDGHDGNEDHRPSLQLGEEEWRRLVRLPDRPSMADLRPLAGVALAALLRANGLRRQFGWSDEEARRALVRWIEEHLREALALPTGKLRLPRSPRRHRSHSRPRRSPSYDGMIETVTEGELPASEESLPPGFFPKHAATARDAATDQVPPPVWWDPLCSRQCSMLRELPPIPTTEDLSKLHRTVLQELLLTNGVDAGLKTKKPTLIKAILQLLDTPGTILRLPPRAHGHAGDGETEHQTSQTGGAGAEGGSAAGALGDSQGRANDSGRQGNGPLVGDQTGAQPREHRAHGGPNAHGPTASLATIPRHAPPYPEDPDRLKLTEQVLAALEALPRRPTAAQLRGAKFAGLQALLKTNGIPRSNSASVASMTTQLCDWLAKDNERRLKLPKGL